MISSNKNCQLLNIQATETYWYEHIPHIIRTVCYWIVYQYNRVTLIWTWYSRGTSTIEHSINRHKMIWSWTSRGTSASEHSINKHKIVWSWILMRTVCHNAINRHKLVWSWNSWEPSATEHSISIIEMLLIVLMQHWMYGRLC